MIANKMVTLCFSHQGSGNKPESEELWGKDASAASDGIEDESSLQFG